MVTSTTMMTLTSKRQTLPTLRILTSSLTFKSSHKNGIGGGSNGNVNNNDDTYEQEANTADFANINVFIDI